MKWSKGWTICTVIAMTVIGVFSIFYPDWRSIINDSGWYSLAYLIPLSVLALWGGNIVFPIMYDAINRWVVPPLIRLLNRGDYNSTRKNQ